MGIAIFFYALYPMAYCLRKFLISLIPFYFYGKILYQCYVFPRRQTVVFKSFDRGICSTRRVGHDTALSSFKVLPVEGINSLHCIVIN